MGVVEKKVAMIKGQTGGGGTAGAGPQVFHFHGAVGSAIGAPKFGPVGSSGREQERVADLLEFARR